MRIAALVALALIVSACTSTSEGSPTSSQSGGSTSELAPRDWFDAACDLPVEYVRRLRRGYFPGRSPEVIVVPKEPNFLGGPTYWSHSGPWAYLQRIPLVFYGPGFIRHGGQRTFEREVTMADVAPTLAELLKTAWPRARPGRALSEVLLPSNRRRTPPRVIVVVVWDGGGRNVLEQWPNAWPNLKRLVERGTAVDNATVGSSPSVTPAVHATLGTGAFANRHGIVDIATRDGDRVRAPFPGGAAPYLRLRTLADIYDPTTDNKAFVGMMSYQSFHIGMMGNGALTPGGDRDIALIAEIPKRPTTTDPGSLEANRNYYSVPSYIKKVGGYAGDIRRADLIDGRSDLLWMGHIDLENPDRANKSPAWVSYQTRVIKTLMRKQGFGQDKIPDLLFVNYKQIDEVGHNWNMLAPEMDDILKSSDKALGDLVSFLQRSIGPKRWVVVLTADHGQTPDPERSGAWAIRISALEADLAAHFNVETTELIQLLRPSGFWLNTEWIAANGVSSDDVADFLVDYQLGDNALGSETIPEQYGSRLDERVFAAAIPSHKLDAVWRCVTSQP